MISILAIDDEKEILYALEAIFESQRWKTYKAQNVKDGIEIIKTVSPDLIVIDYHMPQINGIDGVKAIRKIDAQTPIIAFTIDESQQIADRFLEAGANDFALKPIKAPDLISRIQLHIKLMGMRAQKKSSATADNHVLRKGIGAETLGLIEATMKDNEHYMEVGEIAQKSGLAEQTTYRYIQYMVDEGMLKVNVNYGKIGRPKQSYRLIDVK